MWWSLKESIAEVPPIENAIPCKTTEMVFKEATFPLYEHTMVLKGVNSTSKLSVHVQMVLKGIFMT